ncbi:Uncharacterised protein [Budvicia aquatica]|uniref:Uncharacterized protein n=1 Tax=Budvicia aquatica TaxID=82979 RepID=A0A484ZMR6_9GAMM|nr:Uncharacterised protein [Budvicia aquatica]
MRVVLFFNETEGIDTDKHYIAWINANKNGYVLSIPKNYRTISKLFLSKTTRIHRVNCYLISKYSKFQQSSSFTGKKYFKICSTNQSDLTQKAIHITGLFMIEKCRCMN